jgi:hypothetical protein
MRKWWITLLGCAGAVGLAAGPVRDVAVAEPPPDWVDGQAAIARLGRRLPAVAARNALSAPELRSTLLKDRSLRVDVDGQLLYVEPPAPLGDQATSGPDPLAAAIDPSAAFTLHSRPGSRRVVYLDFDGHMVSGTAWNNKTAGPCFADAYDTDGVPGAFSQAELTAIGGCGPVSPTTSRRWMST